MASVPYNFLYFVSFFPYLWEDGFLVDQGENIHRQDPDEVENSLVIHEFNMSPVDLLLVVFGLFHLEYVADEELLEVLVGVVDAQLLETVRLEVFEAENIQDSDGGATGIGSRSGKGEIGIVWQAGML